MISKKIPVFLFILALVLANNNQQLFVNSVYAQDEEYTMELEVTSDDDGDKPDDEEDWDEDEDFSEDDRTLDETREDGKDADGDFDGSLKAGGGNPEDVSKAREEESKAYQDLYAYEAEHGADGSEEHQKLFDNAGAASAATQVAEGTFGQSNKQKVNEVTSVGEATKDVADDLEELSEEFGGKDDPNYSSRVADVISRHTKNMDMSQVAAVIGGTITNPELAGEVARKAAEERGEGVGTQMGSYQIAYARAGGANITGDQVTKAAVDSTLPSVDLNDPSQSLTFAEAAFSTARTHNADIATVTQQLKALKIPENTILAAAENKGVGKEAGAAQAAAPAVAQAGPANPQVAVPEVPPVAAPAPRQITPPAAQVAQPVRPLAPIQPQTASEFPGYKANTKKADGVTDFPQGEETLASDGSRWTEKKWEGSWTKEEENKPGASYSYSVIISSSPDGKDVKRRVEVQAFAGTQVSEKKVVTPEGDVQTSFSSVEDLKAFLKKNNSDLPKVPFVAPTR